MENVKTRPSYSPKPFSPEFSRIFPELTVIPVANRIATEESMHLVVESLGVRRRNE
jgi:hypothetical protein